MLMIASALLPAQGTLQTAQKGNDQLTKAIEWWPMFHHDVQNTGYTLSNSPDTTHKLWTNLIDKDIWFSSPAIVDDNLVIGTGHRYDDRAKDMTAYTHFYDTEILMKDNTFLDILKNAKKPLSTEIGKLYCLNAKTGQVRWNFEANGSVFSSPIIDNGKVYFVSADSTNFTGNLYCLNMTSGTEMWNLSVMTGFTSPVLSNGRLYLQTINPDTLYGRLQCLDAADGSELWNHTTGYIDFSLYTSPALADGKVFFTSIDVTSGIYCKITCLNQSTGQQLWATKLGSMDFGYALSSPVIDNQKAYVISAETQGTEEFWTILFCLDTSNGSILWNYTMKENIYNEISFSSPAVAYGNVYFSSTEDLWSYGKITCLNGENGSLLWTRKSNDVYTSSSPAISNGKVFIGGINVTTFKGNLYCYDAYNGKLMYTVFIDSDMIDSPPAIADDAVYIGASGGKMIAVRDAFQVGVIKGGLASVKTDIINVGNEDILNLRYTITIVGGIFKHINVQTNDTIPVLEAQTSDTIKASPILGLGKIAVTVTVEMEGVNPVVKTANGFVFGIFVITNIPVILK
jgi:outer membrane protein assembly factor BamB